MASSHPWLRHGHFSSTFHLSSQDGRDSAVTTVVVALPSSAYPCWHYLNTHVSVATAFGFGVAALPGIPLSCFCLGGRSSVGYAAGTWALFSHVCFTTTHFPSVGAHGMFGCSLVAGIATPINAGLLSPAAFLPHLSLLHLPATYTSAATLFTFSAGLVLMVRWLGRRCRADGCPATRPTRTPSAAAHTHTPTAHPTPLPDAPHAPTCTCGALRCCLYAFYTPLHTCRTHARFAARATFLPALHTPLPYLCNALLATCLHFFPRRRFRLDRRGQTLIQPVRG